MTKEKKIKIGIYGGAFNPITKGHLLVARYAIKFLGLDKLIFCPGWAKFDKKNQPIKNKFDPQVKLDMIKLVLEPKMEVSDFEIKRRQVTYTYQTVDYFYQKYYKLYHHNLQLYFIIGSDNLINLHLWDKVEEFAKKAQILVFKRLDKYQQKNTIKKYGFTEFFLKFPKAKKNYLKYQCILMQNKNFPFESTNFRKQGKTNQLDKKVLKYCSNNFLYFEDMLPAFMDQKRLIHSKNTAKMAAKLAKLVNYNVKKAYFAGLLHDICKCFDLKTTQKIINSHSASEKFLPNFKKLNFHEYHQIAGYKFLKYWFLLEDFEILHAILYHTTLSLKVTLLDKIIYVADKICIGRKFLGINKLREMFLINFDFAWFFYLQIRQKQLTQELKLKKIYLTAKQEKIFNYLRTEATTKILQTNFKNEAEKIDFLKLKFQFLKMQNKNEK